MKKLLLTLMLAVVSSSAMAEWVEVAGSAEGTEETEAVTAYADPDTIRKTGNRVKMWVLVDYKITEEESGATSVRQKEEYDCKEKKSRILFVAFYSGHMGKDETIFTHSEPEASLQQSLAGGVAEAVLEFACGGFYPKLPRTFPSISSNAVAEWVEVSRSIEYGVALYADPATIRKSGNMATMWELMDSKTAGEGPGPGNKFIHSLVSQAEYDCKDKRIRFLDFIGFSENMGKGELIESEIMPISEWKLILPEDITYKKMWKIACGK